MRFVLAVVETVPLVATGRCALLSILWKSISHEYDIPHIDKGLKKGNVPLF